MNDDERSVQDAMNNLIKSLLDAAAASQTKEERQGYMDSVQFVIQDWEDNKSSGMWRNAKVVDEPADVQVVRPVNYRREAILAQRARKTA
jgi:hypothetical protein